MFLDDSIKGINLSRVPVKVYFGILRVQIFLTR